MSNKSSELYNKNNKSSDKYRFESCPDCKIKQNKNYELEKIIFDNLLDKKE